MKENKEENTKKMSAFLKKVFPNISGPKNLRNMRGRKLSLFTAEKPTTQNPISINRTRSLLRSTPRTRVLSGAEI